MEYELGFFVKGGDGAADFKPVAHFYKSQVYQLAEYLKIPEEIQRRPPTTDTYSLAQTQEDFYFSMPLEQMDVCLYGRDNNLEPSALAAVTGLSAAAVGRVYATIDAKRKHARYPHQSPVVFW